MQTAHTFKASVHATYRANYLLFLPQEYGMRRGERWPLIVFLHGAGERGTNVRLVAKHGPPKIVKQRPDFPFMVLSPQCPADETWSTGLVMALLDEITEKYAVDES